MFCFIQNSDLMWSLRAIFYFMKHFCPHNGSIHRKFYQNMFCKNKCARKNVSQFFVRQKFRFIYFWKLCSWLNQLAPKLLGQNLNLNLNTYFEIFPRFSNSLHVVIKMKKVLSRSSEPSHFILTYLDPTITL